MRIRSLLILLFVSAISIGALTPSAESQFEKTLPENLHPDFDHDGVIGESDLLLLMERTGANKGGPLYSFPYDLSQDDVIDDLDVLRFIREWKSLNPAPSPVTQEALRDSTGFNDLLAGQTWRLACLTDGATDCDEIVRVVSAGAPIQLGGREVVPIDYGPEGEAPWNRFYLDVTEGVSIAGIEITTPVTRLPGVTVPNQIFSLSGPVPMIEPGMVTPETAVVGSGTASATASISIPSKLRRFIPFSKGLFPNCDDCNFFCSCETRSFCENIFAIYTVATGHGRAVCEWLEVLNLKGNGPVGSGSGTVEIEWEILFDATGLRYANLSYTFLGLKKFLALERLPDLSDCLAESEPNDSLGFVQSLPLNECVTGMVGGGDPGDYFRVSIDPFNEGSLVISLNHSGQGATVTVYNQSQVPLQTREVSGSGNFSFNPINAQSGDDYLLGIVPDGSFSYDASFNVAK
jgi:hypothetical protein